MLVEKFFQADSRNFHAWQYRRFIIEFMKNDKNVKLRNDIIDFDEFKFTTKMINKDISNYSAWHNRTKLLEKLFIKSPIIDEDIEENDTDLKEYLEYFNLKSKSKFLMKELILFKTAMYTDRSLMSILNVYSFGSISFPCLKPYFSVINASYWPLYVVLRIRIITTDYIVVG